MRYTFAISRMPQFLKTLQHAATVRGHTDANENDGQRNVQTVPVSQGIGILVKCA